MNKKPTEKKLLKLQQRFLDMRSPKASDRCLDQVKELAPLKHSLLSELYPEIDQDWLHELNEGFEPDDFNEGSQWMAWWFCPKGPDHIYLQKIEAHTRSLRDETKFGGCPFCAGFYGSKTNNLSTLFPQLTEEWLISMNKPLLPEYISHGCSYKIWWKCRDCKHKWQATVANRTGRDSGCPKCNLGESIDLRDYPKALKQFDRKKNKGVDPYSLKAHDKYHWRCTKDRSHTWVAGFYKTQKGERCPYCKGSKASASNNLGLRKDLSKQWHPTKNGSLKPCDFSLSSHKTVWWKCNKGSDHEWTSMVATRVKGKGSCPFCINHFVSKTNSLASRFPKIAKQWHPTKNKPLTTKDVTGESTKKVWWICNEGPDHEWLAVINTRTKVGTGCPCCANKKLSVTNSLAGYPLLMKEFDRKKNKGLDPAELIAYSLKKVWWRCSNCNRSWQTQIRLRAVLRRGCRPCALRKRRQKVKSSRTSIL